MRKVRCRHCWARWAPRNGPVIAFYDYHAKLHNLDNPLQGPQTVPEYVGRGATNQALIAWRRLHFIDSNLEPKDLGQVQ